MLPQNSEILDIGCGAGEPATSLCTSVGHHVTGIDISQKMIDLARKHVPEADFAKADFTKYEPLLTGQYALVVASHSLYDLTVAEIKSMIRKFARWIKDGGFILIGTGMRVDTSGLLDEHGWIEKMDNVFLGQKFQSTYGTKEAWCNLVQSTGLELFDCKENDSSCKFTHEGEEDTFEGFYLIARKVVE
ncbi:hypothetical protein M422DRAFT_158767 [Sphaerobolus stellatus SS14]|nr:hypothetical protein M422DRAFT_158767 [Sphaerobolus stellatus SS14]